MKVLQRKDNGKVDWKETGILSLILLLPIGVAVSLVCVAIVIFVPHIQKTLDDIEPNGKTAQVKVLEVYTAHNILFDTRICIYEVEGHRDTIAGCLYNVGDTMNLYQLKGGMWLVKEAKA